MRFLKFYFTTSFFSPQIIFLYIITPNTDENVVHICINSNIEKKEVNLMTSEKLAQRNSEQILSFLNTVAPVAFRGELSRFVINKAIHSNYWTANFSPLNVCLSLSLS